MRVHLNCTQIHYSWQRFFSQKGNIIIKNLGVDFVRTLTSFTIFPVQSLLKPQQKFLQFKSTSSLAIRTTAQHTSCNFRLKKILSIIRTEMKTVKKSRGKMHVALPAPKNFNQKNQAKSQRGGVSQYPCICTVHTHFNW